ncbi:hypothetical protein EMCRGX_G013376 [Ephydatia muelleri]
MQTSNILSGVEKHNDDAKRNYFSSNQWDAPAEDRVQAGRAAAAQAAGDQLAEAHPLAALVVTYVVVAFGEDSPVTEIPIRHALDRRQSVEKMLRPPKLLACKEFALHDGPFVKELDEALQSFKVQRQQYLGGVFVGITTFTRHYSKHQAFVHLYGIEVARTKCPTLITPATEACMKFTNIFTLLGHAVPPNIMHVSVAGVIIRF